MNVKKKTKLGLLFEILGIGLIGMAKDVWRVCGSFLAFCAFCLTFWFGCYYFGAAIHWLLGWNVTGNGVTEARFFTGLFVWVLFGALCLWFTFAVDREETAREKKKREQEEKDASES